MPAAYSGLGRTALGTWGTGMPAAEDLSATTGQVRGAGLISSEPDDKAARMAGSPTQAHHADSGFPGSRRTAQVSLCAGTGAPHCLHGRCQSLVPAPAASSSSAGRSGFPPGMGGKAASLPRPGAGPARDVARRSVMAQLPVSTDSEVTVRIASQMLLQVAFRDIRQLTDIRTDVRSRPIWPFRKDLASQLATSHEIWPTRRSRRAGPQRSRTRGCVRPGIGHCGETSTARRRLAATGQCEVAA